MAVTKVPHIMASRDARDNGPMVRRPLTALVAPEVISSLGTLLSVVALPC